jgi:hypothetical protein
MLVKLAEMYTPAGLCSYCAGSELAVPDSGGLARLRLVCFIAMLSNN